MRDFPPISNEYIIVCFGILLECRILFISRLLRPSIGGNQNEGSVSTGSINNLLEQRIIDIILVRSEADYYRLRQFTLGGVPGYDTGRSNNRARLFGVDIGPRNSPVLTVDLPISVSSS